MPWSSPRHIDHMVLFSGDGDFRSLVEAVQRRACASRVISTISTQPPMIADELRRQADYFSTSWTAAQIGRDPAERAAREPASQSAFLQRPPQRSPAGVAAGEPDDDYDD